MLGAMMRGPKSIFFYFFWGGHPRVRPRGTPWGIDGPGIAPHRTSTPHGTPVVAANGHRMGLGADHPRHAPTARPRPPTTCASAPDQDNDTFRSAHRP